MTGAQAGQLLCVLLEIREHLRTSRREAGLPPVVLPAQLVETQLSPNQARTVDVAIPTGADTSLVRRMQQLKKG